MNKNDIICAVAKEAGISKRKAQLAVNSVFSTIAGSLANGESVKIHAFGNFDVRTRPARVCRNPKSGDQITVPGDKTPAFKASKTLKQKF